MNQDIELGEMFGDEAINEPLSVRLVREVIQNSLDASVAKKLKSGERTVEEPVRIRFSLDGLSNPLPAAKASRYFSGLQEHLVAVEGIDETVREKSRINKLLEHDVPFIVIEDDGTTGLRGDPERYDDPDPDSTDIDDFYWFFRNVGRSGKGATENGSWGLGKWVLPDASGASVFFALTTTDEDTLLMGQSVLKEHHVNGTKFAPHGYWSIPENDGFAMPLRFSNHDHHSTVSGFISDFGLTQRDEPGLSVVIPFPRVSDAVEGSSYRLDTKELIKAVVHNYFYPIVHGWLEVRISGESGEIPANITADTIHDIVDVIEATGVGQWTARSYRRVFNMFEEISALSTSDYTILTVPPVADDEYIHAEDLRALEKRYKVGELLPFVINTKVQHKNGSEFDTKFNVYLRQDQDLEIGHDYFIRGTLSIPRIDRIKDFKALALIVVDENEPLAEMLRDSEPPAHTEWRPRAKRVHNRWTRPQNRISSVMNSVRNILSFIENQPSGLQKDAFLDLFAIPGSGIAAESSGDSGGGTKTESPRKPIESGKPSPFTVSPIRGGISINASNSVDDMPERVIVRAAYDVPRGNPFAKFNENDFAFRNKNGLRTTLLRINLVGGDIVEDDGKSPVGANAIRLWVKDRDNFSFKISGFDQYRDVVVKIDPDENN